MYTIHATDVTKWVSFIFPFSTRRSHVEIWNWSRW